MTTGTTLLPCPFCGGVAHLIQNHIRVSVFCMGCGVTTDEKNGGEGSFETCVDHNKGLAVKAWNRRTA